MVRPVDLCLEMRAGRAARRPDRPRAEPCPRTIGHEIVHRRTDHGCVDPAEVGRVLGVRQAGEREEPGIVGLVRQTQRAPAFERVDHAADATSCRARVPCLYGDGVLRLDRHETQLAVRVAALVFVAAWLFSTRLQGLVPYWIPFVVLCAAELEFAVRGWRDSRSGATASPAETRERRLPGADDEDLGWGKVVEGDDGELIWVPPPTRQRSGSRRLL